MKKLIILAATFFITSPVIFAQGKAGKKDTTVHASYYTCPMHPDVVSSKPGKCPKCGMDLNLSTKEQMKLNVTKTYACPIHVDVTSNKPGKCPKCGKIMTLSPKEKMKAEAVKLYTCSMHPDVTSDKPGNCPKCGMALTEKK
ncbi:MAG: heavy metal-binding domain-containing protein [Bacteroidota bacterium]|nr:heavy metal-binding domain-containing protein [Bacteroidota bacterium]